MEGLARAAAVLIVFVTLALSRFLAGMVNVHLWLRLLARTGGAATSEVQNQIYLPQTVRRGVWPGLFFFLPTLLLGLALTQQGAVTFGVGVLFMSIGGVLMTGLLWGVIRDVYPNRHLAETRIALLTASIQSDDREPVSSYRRYWRALYQHELITAVEGDAHSASPASRRRTAVLIAATDADINAALRALSDGDPLRSSLEKLHAKNQTTLAAAETKLDEVEKSNEELTAKWPVPLNSLSGSVRLLQAKDGAALLYVLSVDDVDLLAPLQSRKKEVPLIVNDFSALPKAPKDKASAIPWLEMDITLPVAPGRHRLTYGKGKESTTTEELDIEAGRRYLGLITFDVYASNFTLTWKDVTHGSVVASV